MNDIRNARQRLHSQWQQLETRIRTLEDERTPDLTVLRAAGELAQVVIRLDNLLIQIQTHLWPVPTTPEPRVETLEAWLWEGYCEATDGCRVEPDAKCEHGHPSWLLRLGLI